MAVPDAAAVKLSCTHDAGASNVPAGAAVLPSPPAQLGQYVRMGERLLEGSTCAHAPVVALTTHCGSCRGGKGGCAGGVKVHGGQGKSADC